MTRTPDGRFLQAEVTSCGLNGGPLTAKGTYEARIACNLWAVGHTTGRVDGRSPKKRLRHHPYFTQTGKDREENGDQYIANMESGACAGFKYFLFDGSESTISVKGRGEGVFKVSVDPAGREIIASVPMNGCVAFTPITGKKALYFTYYGGDAADFTEFTIK